MTTSSTNSVMRSKLLSKNEWFSLPFGPTIATLLLLCRNIAVTNSARSPNPAVSAIPEADQPWRPRRVNVNPELFSPARENMRVPASLLTGPITHVEASPLRNPIWTDGTRLPTEETVRVELLQARITMDHLDAGRGAATSNRQFINNLGARGSEGFEAGHIIANILGGPAGAGRNFNIIPQYYRTNMAQVIVENLIYNHVRRMGTVSRGHATEVRVRLLYDGPQTGYPYAIVMNINDNQFVDENGRRGPASYYIANHAGEAEILDIYRSGYDPGFERFQRDWVVEDEDGC